MSLTVGIGVLIQELGFVKIWLGTGIWYPPFRTLYQNYKSLIIFQNIIMFVFKRTRLLFLATSMGLIDLKIQKLVLSWKHGFALWHETQNGQQWRLVRWHWNGERNNWWSFYDKIIQQWFPIATKLTHRKKTKILATSPAAKIFILNKNELFFTPFSLSLKY